MTNELMTVDGGALTPSQTAILTQRTPSGAIKKRRGPGGKMLSYVEHSWVTATLNEAFGWAWSWDVIEWRLMPVDEPTEVFVLGRLTVHSEKGDLVKTQFGSAGVKRAKSSGKPLSIGDDLKAASSDALKKAASLLGLALDLYGSEPPKPARNPQPNGNGNGNNGGAFTTPTAAVAWAMTTGVFKHQRHAQNAYAKLKSEKQPKSAEEMGRLWRADVARRKAEKERDEALPAEPSRGKNRLYK